jgi:hypothetical protein
MRVDDRHHVRPRFVDGGIDEALFVLIGQVSRDGSAVEIILDNVRALTKAGATFRAM